MVNAIVRADGIRIGPSLRMPRRFLRGAYGRLALTILSLALGVALVCAIDLANRAVAGAFTEIVDRMAGRAALQMASRRPSVRAQAAPPHLPPTKSYRAPRNPSAKEKHLNPSARRNRYSKEWRAVRQMQYPRAFSSASPRPIRPRWTSSSRCWTRRVCRTNWARPSGHTLPKFLCKRTPNQMASWCANSSRHDARKG